MNRVAAATTASSALPEQSIVANLTAEVMVDVEDGQPSLIASTLANQADLQVISPTALLQLVDRQRAQLDQIEALAQEYADKVAIPAFLEEFGIELEELDTTELADLNPKLAAGLHAFSAVMKDGTWLVVVPKGQVPTTRLAAIRDLVNHMKERA
ncbi:hypothetical protein ACFWJU_18520 [Streptomyces mutabilis]|uniref:hypothetical protein n=1 Tax=Streptomyces mutabilis TaxID=67332 RepID=UPI003658A5E8